MVYVTVPAKKRNHQITLEEILMGEVTISDNTDTRINSNTVTHQVKLPNQRMFNVSEHYHARMELAAFVEKYKNLIELEDKSSLYFTFYIPKKSGGLRRIDAPNTELMEALRQLKNIFETKFFASYHTSAFAYVRGRCAADSVVKHQRNKSRWFLKTDFENFFGNTSHEYILKMLRQIFPFSEFFKNARDKELLEKSISLCILNGGLPQGTPISPLLTNLVMIPVDHVLSNELRKDGFVYTRYADDIVISHRKDFKYSEKCEFVDSVLDRFGAPYHIKPTKTRYGSSAGSNWILGVMLNKDNNITVGHKRKEQLRGMCLNYMADKRNGITWDIHDVQVMAGLIAYYKGIEPEYMKDFVEAINKKTGGKLMAEIRKDLKGD